MKRIVKELVKQLRNIADKIEDGEDAAYLIGYIVQRMYEKIKNYLSTKK